MIGRRSSLAIATAYSTKFASRGYNGKGDTVYRDALYDFLYAASYEAWFCNQARQNRSQRDVKDWVLKLHTGESLADVTKSWTWEQRQRLGQQYLRNLARDFVAFTESKEADAWAKNHYGPLSKDIRSSLELDGYVLRDGDFIRDEADVMSVEEESGVLHELFTALKMPAKEDAFAFLKLCDEHYIGERWSDSIANARKFLELTLRESCRVVASARGRALDEKRLERPVEVRALLEEFTLLEHRERETLDKTYGLLSHTGGHPYMAEKDQARLLRQLTLTLSQFVLLRVQGAVSGASRSGAA